MDDKNMLKLPQVQLALLRIKLTLLVLVPNLHESIALAGSSKKCAIRRERHMMDRRSCVTLPHALPRLILTLGGVLLIVGRTRISAANFKLHIHRFTVVFDILVPHLEHGAAGEQSCAF